MMDAMDPCEVIASQQGVSHLHLSPMAQLAEALDKEDDWTGITDAVSRRKMQNRLNVRAYRRRKALESQSNPTPAAATISKRTVIKSERTVPFWVEEQQMVISYPSSVVGVLKGSKPPLIPYHGTTVSHGQLNLPERGKIIFPLSPDHLITLLQYNALRACLVNRRILSGLDPSPFPVEDCSSAALHLSRDPNSTSALPPSLQPTALQRTIPHEGWLDIMPHPKWRDNLLLALGTFDEDELWADTLGGLFEGFPEDEIERRGVIAWEPPWDFRGWEISEGFLRKWQWSFKGCEDALEATNGWRRKRGEKPLRF